MNIFQNILTKAKSQFVNPDPTKNLQYKAIDKLAGGISSVTGQGMSDPTQSYGFKAIQGGANLYTGVKSRIQETAQQDIVDKQSQLDADAEKFAQSLLDQGYNEAQVMSALDELEKKGELTAKPNLGERIVGGLGQRMETIQKGTERLAGEKNLAKRIGAGSAFYGGSAVATAFEPVGAVVQPLVEPIIKPVVGSKLGQATIRKAQELDKKYPIASLGAQGVGNIAQLAPLPFAKPLANIATKGAKGAVNIVKPVIGKTVEVASKEVGKIPQSVRKGATAWSDKIVENGFARMTKKRITNFKDEIGEGVGEFLNKRGIKLDDDLVETMASKMKESKTQADNAVGMIEGRFKMPETKLAEGQNVDYLGQMLESNAKQSLKQQLPKESLRASELLDKYNSEGLSMAEINEAQRYFQTNNTFDYFAKALKPEKVKRVTQTDRAVRDWKMAVGEANGLTNLRDINKTTKAYYKLMEGIGDWQEGISGNNILGLGDYLSFIADPKLFLAKQVAGASGTKRFVARKLGEIGGREVQSDIVKASKKDIITEQLKKRYGTTNDTGGDHPSYQMGEQRPRLELPAPTGKATGAKNIRVNQPLEKSQGVKEVFRTESKRPTGDVKTENIVVKLKQAKVQQATIENIKADIASSVKSARYGGTGNTRLEPQINKALLDKKISVDEAIGILDEIMQNKSKYLYIDYKRLSKYIDEVRRGDNLKKDAYIPF